MQITLVCTLVVAALTFTGAASAATDPALRFLRDGTVVKTIDLPTLRRSCTVQTVEIDDPYYQAKKAFLAYPLRCVLELGLGPLGASFDRENVFLRARDGYVKPATGARLSEDGGYLAFADARRTHQGAEPRWDPIDRRQVDPGPYYLVWAKPHQRDVHRYPWPYQLVAIEIASFDTEYPHTLPRTAAPDSAAWAGFAVFRNDCIACHAINGEGGTIGPELNVPQSIVEYRPAGQIKAYIRDPATFRYGSMPAHPHLSEQQLDELLAYFTTMKALKHDPETHPMNEAALLRHPVHGTLVRLGARPLSTTHGDFVLHVFHNLATRDYALAIACGDLTTPAPLLTRIHSSCVTSESYGSRDCDCAEQLDTALTRLADAGRGVVFYLMQEGRGAGIAVKARDRMIVQASGNRLTTFEAYAQMGLGKDRRRYDEVGFACRLLGITAPLELLTNNPDKIAAVEAQGLQIAGVMAVRHAVSPFNVHYLAAKSRSGHALANADGAAEAATPPESVTYSDPMPLPHAPHLVHMASYFLPVALRDGGESPGPHWFRLHAYLDVTTGRERVVLTYGRPEHAAPLVRLQPDTLLERFSLSGGGTHRRRWNATVRAFVGHGAGCAVFVPRDDLVEPAAERGGDADETTWLLLAHHVTARRVRPVLGGAGEVADEPTLRAALARRGLECEVPLLLGGDA